MAVPEWKRKRHGMSVSDEEVVALLSIFATIDRGGDPSVMARTETVRKYRAALQRIKDGRRLGARVRIQQKEAS